MAELKAQDVKDALRKRHGAAGGTGEWVCIEEAFCGWRSAGGGIDLLAIGAWQTAKAPGLPGAGRDVHFPIVAYEVKVSRADYRREIYGYTPGPNARRWSTRSVPAWPNKAYFALQRSHYFMFAVPKGLLKEEEIERREKPEDGKGLYVPPEAGLLEVDGTGCKVRIPAVATEATPLKWPETAELLRHGLDPNSVRKVRAENAYLRGRVEDLQRRLRAEQEEARAYG